MVELHNTVPILRTSNNQASSEETLNKAFPPQFQMERLPQQQGNQPTTTSYATTNYSYPQYQSYYANYYQYYGQIDQSIKSGNWTPVVELFENLLVYFRNFAHTDSYRNYMSTNVFNSAVKVYEQLFVEAVESDDKQQAQRLFDSHLKTMAEYQVVQELSKILQQGKSYFDEFKENVLKLNKGESCVLMRPLLASDVSALLNAIHPAEVEYAFQYMNYVQQQQPRPEQRPEQAAVSSVSSFSYPSTTNQTIPTQNSIALLNNSSPPKKRKFQLSSIHIPNSSSEPAEVLHSPRTLLLNKKSLYMPTEPAAKKQKVEEQSSSSSNLDLLVHAYDMLKGDLVTPSEVPKNAAKFASPYTESPSSSSSSAYEDLSVQEERIRRRSGEKSIRKNDLESITSEKKDSPTEASSASSSMEEESASIKPTKKLADVGISSTPAIRKRMIGVLIEHKDEPISWQTILAKTTGNRAKIWMTLVHFVNFGLVEQVGKGRRNQPFKYQLAEGIKESDFDQFEPKFLGLDAEGKKKRQELRQKKKQEALQQKEQEVQTKRLRSSGHEMTLASSPPSITGGISNPLLVK